MKSPSQVCKAGNGIAWANNSGLYYFDGEELKEVTKDRIDDISWDVEEDDDKTINIGWENDSKKIIVNTTNTETTDNGGYIYDLNTDSIVRSKGLFNWFSTDDIPDTSTSSNPPMNPYMVEGVGNTSNIGSNTFVPSIRIPPNVYISNMQVMPVSKKLISAAWFDTNPQAVNISEWKDNPRSLFQHRAAANYFKIQTRDIDFENPARRKKIYKVYVTFKASNYVSNVIANYSINGSNVFTGTFKDSTYYSATKGFDASSLTGDNVNDWITAELKPTTTLKASSVFSFQLQFSYAEAGRAAVIASGSSSSAVLDSGASGTDDIYNGMPIIIFAGPGASSSIGRINAYDGDTKTATITGLDTYTYSSNTYYELGFIPSEFEINDITIIYRNKSIK